MRSRSNGNSSGQTLVVAILLLAVAAITVPALVYYVQNEGKWTVKEARSTTAYHLAEAAQDRGAWYLTQSTGVWSAALNGTATAGYAGDVIYSDVAGGQYQIIYSSGPQTNQITVTTKGRESSSKEIRGIRAVYSGAPLLSGLVTYGTFGLNANFYIYWGQLTSYSNITQTAGQTAFTGCSSSHGGTETGGASYIPYYPFKNAATSISPWQTTPTPPTSDTVKNYKAYDSSLASIPGIDFDYYRAAAKNSLVPVPSDTTLQSAAYHGTGYFDGTGNHELVWGNYFVNCSTCVIFIEHQDLKLDTGPGFVILNALIVYQGNFHIHTDGWYGYSLTVPDNAWQQFTAGTYINPNGPGDTGASGEFPGDCGPNLSCATYTVPNSSHTAGSAWVGYPYDQCQNTGLSFRGFLYVDSFNCSLGHNVLSGAISVGPGGTSIGSGGGGGSNVTHVIYYDPVIGGGVRYVDPPLSRVSWKEFKPSWP